MPVSKLTAYEHHRLQQAITRGMRYWFCRVMLGWGAVESDAFARQYVSLAQCRLSRNGAKRGWSRRRYRELRHAGESHYAASSKMHGDTPAQQQQRVLAYQRKVRQRYEGQPSHVGSEAWKRRIIDRWERMNDPR